MTPTSSQYVKSSATFMGERRDCEADCRNRLGAGSQKARPDESNGAEAGRRRASVNATVSLLADGRSVGDLHASGLALGIPLALAGAFCMSFGAQRQHDGVAKVGRSSGSTTAGGLKWAHVQALVRRPSWIVGTLLLGLAVVCQLGAIWAAPLMVVQPLGVVALLVTTLLNARASGPAPTKKSWSAIAACMAGIVLFATLAGRYSSRRPIANSGAMVILAALLVVTLALLLAWVIMRRRLAALFFVAAAGTLYGFVATLAKVIIDRFQDSRLDWFVVGCAVALIMAAALGGYFVQSAYSSGPPELVVAGLTVVDPLVAVVIAMVIPGEAAAAPAWAFVGFALAGAVAVWGVIGLARHHPQVKRSVA